MSSSPESGAFAPAIDRIDQLGMRDVLTTRIEDGRPTLAICLGMQLLCASSEESPDRCRIGDRVRDRHPICPGPPGAPTRMEHGGARRSRHRRAGLGLLRQLVQGSQPPRGLGRGQPPTTEGASSRHGAGGGPGLPVPPRALRGLGIQPPCGAGCGRRPDAGGAGHPLSRCQGRPGGQGCPIPAAAGRRRPGRERGRLRRAGS